MPNFRNFATIPLGILLALILAVIVFIIDHVNIQVLVNTLYSGLTGAHQLITVAWLLATIDRLLDLSAAFSLLLWVLLIVIGALVQQQLTNTLKMVSTALLFPAGAWLLFAFKYSSIGGLNPVFLLYFLFWRLLIPLGFGLFLGGLFSLPFWLNNRRRRQFDSKPVGVRFVCKRCGSEYRSKPLVCVHCGAEGVIHELELND